MSKLIFEFLILLIIFSKYQSLNPAMEMNVNNHSQNHTGAAVDTFKYSNEFALKFLWPIIPIFFLILGTILNILAILVFLRREMIKYSSFCYFAILNIVNLAFLYVTIIRIIMEHNFKSDIRKLSLFSCKTHVFLTYFLSHLSSLLLCAISVDRAISVMFLRKAKELCTPRIAFKVTMVLILFNFLLSSHFLVLDSGHQITQNISNQTFVSIQCDADINSTYHKFVEHFWKLIDMTMYAFLPFLIMLTCSLIILVRVAQQSKKFNTKKSKKATSSSSNSNGTKKEKEELITANSQSVRNFSARTRNLALMLIPVNILFLIFLAPVVIAMFTYNRLGEDLLTLAIVEFLSYFNFSLNFFIYFLTSSKFREEFLKLVDETFIRLKVKKSVNVTEFKTSSRRNHNLNNTELSPLETQLKQRD